MKKLILILPMFLMVACGNSVDFKESPIPNFEGRGSVSPEELNFDNLNTKIFTAHCTQCHVGYNDYQAVFEDKDKILSAVLKGTMPKNAPALNDELKLLLASWVRAGAPEGSSVNAPPVVTELGPTWESLSRRVFFPKCVQCHNPQGQAKFLDLSTRQSFFENRVGLLGNFENAETSYLVEVLQDTIEPMPPTFSGLERLTDEEIQIVIEWIKQGLP